MTATNTALASKVHTVQQRSVEATSRLRTLVGRDDLKLLSTAVAEAAAEEAKQNSAFTQRVRALYDELASLKDVRTSRSRKASEDDVPLVPIGHIEGRKIDPAAPLDPYFIFQLYGKDQLRRALSRYSLANLKEGLAQVERRNPGTKPRSRASKQAIIDYIFEHVAI